MQSQLAQVAGAHPNQRGIAFQAVVAHQRAAVQEIPGDDRLDAGDSRQLRQGVLRNGNKIRVSAARRTGLHHHDASLLLGGFYISWVDLDLGQVADPDELLVGVFLQSDPQ